MKSNKGAKLPTAAAATSSFPRGFLHRSDGRPVEVVKLACHSDIVIALHAQAFTVSSNEYMSRVSG